jgi:hypothetical protein
MSMRATSRSTGSSHCPGKSGDGPAADLSPRPPCLRYVALRLRVVGVVGPPAPCNSPRPSKTRAHARHDDPATARRRDAPGHMAVGGPGVPQDASPPRGRLSLDRRPRAAHAGQPWPWSRGVSAERGPHPGSRHTARPWTPGRHRPVPPAIVPAHVERGEHDSPWLPCPVLLTDVVRPAPPQPRRRRAGRRDRQQGDLDVVAADRRTTSRAGPRAGRPARVDHVPVVPPRRGSRRPRRGAPGGAASGVSGAANPPLDHGPCRCPEEVAGGCLPTGEYVPRTGSNRVPAAHPLRARGRLVHDPGTKSSLGASLTGMSTWLLRARQPE